MPMPIVVIVDGCRIELRDMVPESRYIKCDLSDCDEILLLSADEIDALIATLMAARARLGA